MKEVFQHPMRQVRELVLQSFYQWLIHPNSVDPNSQHLEKVDAYQLAVSRVKDLYPEAKLAIITVLSDNQWNRLHLIEQAIMVQVYYELLECPKLPYRVIINEAVELAKKYGGDQSHRLVNVLSDKLALILRPIEVAARSATTSKISVPSCQDSTELANGEEE